MAVEKHIGASVINTSVNKRDNSFVRMAHTSNSGDERKSVRIELAAPPPKADTASDLHIFGLNLAHLSPLVQFSVCTGGVFLFYLVYGYFQELIFRQEGFKPFGWYLTLLQFAFYAVFGVTELQFKEDKRRKIPLKTYAVLALLTVATMGLSNASLGYLNYPTQVIFKCCKLIPVLIGGIIIQGKTYGKIDWAACFCMSIGLIFFTLVDSSVSPSFSIYGVTLISLALCADAIIGNVQEKAMKHFVGSNAEMVIYSYGIGFFYILAGQIITGQFFEAFSYCLMYPNMYGYAFVFSLTGYLGINFVLSLIKIFGALLAVTVTTCRKALTMVLSFLLFAKPFSFQYVWSGSIVLLGIYLNIYSKNKHKWNPVIKQYIDRYIYGKRIVVRVSDIENIV